MFNTIGLTLVNKAISNGPMGPVTAIVAVSSILLVLVEAIRKKTWMSAIEIVALILGFTGAMELILPKKVERALKFFFCCGERCDTKQKIQG